jgi:hypothetical protein
VLGLAVVLIAVAQLHTAFHYHNDPAARGLVVGQRIGALRQGSADVSGRPVLIEVAYWQYLAIHVGANDMSSLVYDRPVELENRDSPSQLELLDTETLRHCLAVYDISYVVVASGRLREIAEGRLGLVASEQVSGFAFYPVPTSMAQEDRPGQSPCPGLPCDEPERRAASPSLPVPLPEAGQSAFAYRGKLS